MDDLSPKQIADAACYALSEVAIRSMRAGREGMQEYPADVDIYAQKAISCITLLQQMAEAQSKE